MKNDKLTALQFATSMTGHVKPEIIKRVQRYLKRPTFENWDDISGIIIDGRGRMKTIWNAVIEAYPFFPRRGRRTNLAGDVLQEWEQKPEPAELIHAINKAIFSDHLNQLT